MNNDYARHVHRTWLDTHNQCIRTDPEIYLPGEIVATIEDGDGDDGNNDEVDSEDEDELSNISAGMKRKTTTKIYRSKVAKTSDRGGPSTAALTVIDDRRPDLTLIDAPVGEDLLSHPYGRHSCLYVEVKVDASEKPNPYELICPSFLEYLITNSMPLNRSRMCQEKTTTAYSKVLKARRK